MLINIRKFLSVGIIGLLAPAIGLAGELHVPQEFEGIQAAIDAAQPGDSVIVQPGIYREQIRIRRGVTLRSAGDDSAGKVGLARAEGTVLDSGGKFPALAMGQDASIDGLTVTGAGSFDQAEFDKHHAERGENLSDEEGIVGDGRIRVAILIAMVDASVSNCIVHDNGGPGIGACRGGLQGEHHQQPRLPEHGGRDRVRRRGRWPRQWQPLLAEPARRDRLQGRQPEHRGQSML